MYNKNNIELCKMRLAKAEDCMKKALKNLAIEDYDIAANRSYYAIFHAMRALNALEDVDFKHHSGVISHFRKTYIKTHIFESELSNIITNAFDMRQFCDYDDYYNISPMEVEAQVRNAEFFLNNVKFYINKQLNEE